MATVDDVRRLALALPATKEKASYGTPGFRVRDRLFTRVHDDPELLVVWCNDVDEKEALLASDPRRFTTTPHYDGYPLVLVRLAAVDTDELGELLTEAWRVRAPAKLVRQLDEESPGA